MAYRTDWRLHLRRADLLPEQRSAFLAALSGRLRRSPAPPPPTVTAGDGIISFDLDWDEDLLDDPIIFLAQRIQTMLRPGGAVVIEAWGETSGDRWDLVVSASEIKKVRYEYVASRREAWAQG